MNCPKCGDVCSCSVSPVTSELAEGIHGAEIPEALVESQGTSAERNPDAWRDELSQRLNRYRARRKAPPPRYPSLKLPFEHLPYPAKLAPIDPASASAFEVVSDHALALDGRQPDPAPPEPAVPPDANVAVPIPHGSAKIIEFPRFAWAPPPPPPDQLAGPVGEQLRILEVPEFQPPPPALGGITIEPAPAGTVEKRLGIDIPLQIAPWERRLAASVVDGLVIACAGSLFGFIFWKIAAIEPPKIQLLGLAAGTLAVFWAAYQYLLIIYSGSTPGLLAAGLELTRFDGSATTRSLRRWRILASYLSALSLGMGYAWVFLDEDSLCWHDRITRTHFGMKKTPPAGS